MEPLAQPRGLPTTLQYCQAQGNVSKRGEENDPVEILRSPITGNVLDVVNKHGNFSRKRVSLFK